MLWAASSGARAPPELSEFDSQRSPWSSVRFDMQIYWSIPR